VTPWSDATGLDPRATARNVFAESTVGDDSNVVMAGAHLDSVQDGAAINDNGSGSVALLRSRSNSPSRSRPTRSASLGGAPRQAKQPSQRES
jgi:hypothetical protein